MRYAMLGRSGLVVSRLALGAMTFTGGNRSMPSINKVDLPLADRLVGRAIEAGINLFDTADVYDAGQSEEVLGAVLKPHRNEVLIATKCGIRSGTALIHSGLSARHIHASVDASLRRLDTSWIDLLIVHRVDPLTPLEETLAALDAVVSAGKVRYIGYSNWPAWRVATAVEMQRANGWARFINGQVHYSAMIRDRRARYDSDDGASRPRSNRLEPARIRLPDWTDYARKSRVERASLHRPNLRIRPRSRLCASRGATQHCRRAWKNTLAGRACLVAGEACGIEHSAGHVQDRAAQR